MNSAFAKPSLLQRVLPVFSGFDGPLLAALVVLSIAGLVTMYSVGFDHGTRFVDHGRNMVLAACILFLMAGSIVYGLIALPIHLICRAICRAS